MEGLPENEGNGESGAAPAVDRNERPLGGGDRPIGAARSRPATSGTDGGLSMGDYVPTTREIESGAVQVVEVQEVKDTDPIQTADLQAGENTEEQLQFVLENSTTKNWADRFDVLHDTRKLVKYSPECLEPHMCTLEECLVKSLGNPRSSVIRESLQLVTDIFLCASLKTVTKAEFSWTKLVPAILQKAINDKKFLAIEGMNALDAFTKDWPEHYRVFLVESDNRNAKIAAIATRVVAQCVQSLGDGLKDVEPEPGNAAPLQKLATCAVKAMLKGKLAELRDHGKGCLECVIKAAGGWDSFKVTYGPKISKGDMKHVALAFGPPEEAEDGAEAAPAPGIRGRVRPFSRQRVAQAQSGDTMCETVLAARPVVTQAAADPVVAQDETPAAILRQKSSTPRSRRSSDAEVLSEF